MNEVFVLDNRTNVKLTSAEVAALWTQYINETASICFNKHMMEHIEDDEIKNEFKYAMSLSTNYVEKIKEFLKADKFPVPIGFTGNDYIPNDPRIFSDVLCLHYRFPERESPFLQMWDASDVEPDVSYET